MDTSLLNQARTGMFTFENYEEGSILGNMLYHTNDTIVKDLKAHFLDEFLKIDGAVLCKNYSVNCFLSK